MNFDLIEIVTATMILFAVIDIIGSIPIIVEVKRKGGNIRPLRATLVSLIIMLSILFIGEQIINLIGIDINSFAVAGSFVLFFLALEMILGVKIFKDDEHVSETASIVPIAFPLIAGAGTLTTILSIRAEFASINIVFAIILNMVLVFIVLRLTGGIERILGEVGIVVLKKVFGIILLALAVKLFSQNVQLLFQQI